MDFYLPIIRNLSRRIREFLLTYELGGMTVYVIDTCVHSVQSTEVYMGCCTMLYLMPVNNYSMMLYAWSQETNNQHFYTNIYSILKFIFILIFWFRKKNRVNFLLYISYVVSLNQCCGSGSGLFGSPGSGSFINKKTLVILIFSLYKIV